MVWQNSMHAQAAGLPAPQSRDRMYIVFWRKDRKTRTGGARRPELRRAPRSRMRSPVPPLLIPVEGREGKAASLATDPLRTQPTRNETAIVVPLRNHGFSKPVTFPIDAVAANGNHHALVMRNNHGGAEMTTPATELLRTLTTGGHRSLLVP